MNHRRQALVGAPLERVWRLVGDPRTYPEWWPLVVSVRGERIEEGLEYIQVTRAPLGPDAESAYRVEQLDDMRELMAQCQTSGAFVRWRLTGARDETFVEIELGMDPEAKALKYRAFGKAYTRPLYRRWTDEALTALEGTLARGGGAAAGS